MKSVQLAGVIVSYAVIAVFWSICVRRWKRSGTSVWGAIGTARDESFGKDIAAGMVMATIAILLIFLVEWKLEFIAVMGVARPDLTFLGWILLIPFAAFFEELLFRGLVLNGALLAVKNEWAALLLSAAVFGVSHSNNANASLLSVGSTCIGGLVYGYAFLRTRRLWLGFGLHMAWNLVQGPLLGFPLSGFDTHGLVLQRAMGPILWTGGSYGPEAGLIGIVARGLLLAMLAGYLGRRRGDSNLLV